MIPTGETFIIPKYEYPPFDRKMISVAKRLWALQMRYRGFGRDIIQTDETFIIPKYEYQPFDRNTISVAKRL
jgi:hypothetical protein